jgi:hypothetical protein
MATVSLPVSGDELSVVEASVGSFCVKDKNVKEGPNLKGGMQFISAQGDVRTMEFDANIVGNPCASLKDGELVWYKPVGITLSGSAVEQVADLVQLGAGHFAAQVGMEGAYINTLIKTTKYGPQLNVGLFGMSTASHVTFTKHSDTFGIKVKTVFPPRLPSPPRDRPSPRFLLRDAETGEAREYTDGRTVVYEDLAHKNVHVKVRAHFSAYHRSTDGSPGVWVELSVEEIVGDKYSNESETETLPKETAPKTAAPKRALPFVKTAEKKARK